MHENALQYQSKAEEQLSKVSPNTHQLTLWEEKEMNSTFNRDITAEIPDTWGQIKHLNTGKD